MAEAKIMTNMRKYLHFAPQGDSQEIVPATCYRTRRSIWVKW